MERKLLKTSAAISELNKGKILGYDTTDGVAYIRKKSNQIYEMLIKSDGDKAEPVFEGNFKALMKTLNGSLNNKCYIVNDSIRF
ncbi:hypothetical protein MF621_004128 (plasmid) [Bacillus velezensis]|uniref:hypothetical protein n=1 Tax=Bacillus velezensis TaxID=492670 RepID=UPI00049EAC8B|nr:hypothetical protein [Bacillus velezensis]KDN91331.1 hypothetical protein EF87_19310 [Bacillus amyloliquefaciens]URJ76421.1 hypothetical protein MF619_003994 [Bacillus velezensis]URJ80377.1 hypothetical protein MF621_004128 [Bacillus velezensis]